MTFERIVPLEYRAYFLGNMYLSSIQQGIQAQHCTAEMFVKYREAVGDERSKKDAMEKLYYWAAYHKTSILLNGGYKSEMDKMLAHFNNEYNLYPHAAFYESEEALGGVLTCIGIVLSNKVYDCAIHKIPGGLLQQANPETVTKDDYEVMLHLGYWREQQYPQPTHLEVELVKRANLTWWEFVTALYLKRFYLAR